MARIQIDKIIDHLGLEIRQSLREAIKHTDSSVHIQISTLFNYFLEAVNRNCSEWEEVPDKYVASR